MRATSTVNIPAIRTLPSECRASFDASQPTICARARETELTPTRASAGNSPVRNESHASAGIGTGSSRHGGPRRQFACPTRRRQVAFGQEERQNFLRRPEIQL